MDRLQPIRVGGRYINPAFVQPPNPPTHGTDDETDERGFRALVKWRMERRKYAEHEPHVERTPRTTPLGKPPTHGIACTWIGHSTLVLQLDGKTYLLDPVWSNRIGGVVKRQTEPGLTWDQIPDPDALILSHDHYDHLDANTIKRLPRHTPIFAPTGVGPWLRKRGFHEISERSWWEHAHIDGHRLTCVPAQHFSGRTPWGRDRTLWAGWIIQGHHGTTTYFAGDSGYFDGFRQIGDAFPHIDLALIPIGAYTPRWFMAPVHVDPPQAGQAYLDTHAHHLIPIHWGTFRLADEPIDEPPKALTAWWNQKNLDPTRLHIPKLGETITLHPPTSHHLTHHDRNAS